MTIVVNKLPRRKKKIAKLTPEEEALVLALRADGFSREQIADELIALRKAKGETVVPPEQLADELRASKAKGTP